MNEIEGGNAKIKKVVTKSKQMIHSTSACFLLIDKLNRIYIDATILISDMLILLFSEFSSIFLLFFAMLLSFCPYAPDRRSAASGKGKENRDQAKKM